MILADYREAWAMKPRKLTADEIECPEKVIRDFFHYVHLPEARAYLWEGLKTMVTGNYACLRVRDRANLIYFFEQVEKLLEIAHVLYQRRPAAANNPVDQSMS